MLSPFLFLLTVIIFIFVHSPILITWLFSLSHMSLFSPVMIWWALSTALLVFVNLFRVRSLKSWPLLVELFSWVFSVPGFFFKRERNFIVFNLFHIVYFNRLIEIFLSLRYDVLDPITLYLILSQSSNS